MSRIRIIVVAVVLFVLGYLFWTWDSTGPEIYLAEVGDVVGRSSTLRISVSDQGRGLRSIDVDLSQEEVKKTVLSESYPSAPWPWQKGEPERTLAIGLDDLAKELKDGELKLTVRAEDQANFWLFSRSATAERTLRFDSRPPSVSVLAGRHYIRQGGSEVVVFETNEAADAAGVRVGQRDFKAFPLPSRGPRAQVALIGLSYDHEPDTLIDVWAVDLAGNRGSTSLDKSILRVRFRQRSIEVGDRFIEKVKADILPRSPEIAEKDSLVETYVEINSRLRQINDARIAELSGESAAQAFWTEPFLQLSNSQVEASFADRRNYRYKGKEIDRQTHQGFDLASLARSPVEAANAGKVLWADYLGIYGNCVILDHGLGLLSLYGHLSQIDVQPGTLVTRGQSLGRTGATGLAGGDHLHFTMLVQGFPVNPLEWWDEEWVSLHFTSRLTPPPEE